MNAIKSLPLLSSALHNRRSLAVPGAYDALSARLVEEAGFPAVYVGSYATAAAGFGLPDVGALTLDDLAKHAGSVAAAVSVPVIADAEGGFFDPANIWRTVRAFESRGVSAIHIEDHAGGKHTDLPQRLIPSHVMVSRLQAAMDARQSEDFVVIARTDAIWATHDVDEALRRLEAFAAIGIEYLFANGASPDVLRTIRNRIPGKFVVINLPEVRDRSDWNGAADIVLDYGFCLQAVTKVLTSALSVYAATTQASETDIFLEDPNTFEDRLNYKGFVARSKKYGL